MISAKRTVNIFRQTGGGDEFTKPADQLANEQHTHLQPCLGGEQALIVGMHSADDWFALTPLHLVLKNHNELRSVPLENIEWIVTPQHNYKHRGGNLGVKLRDGSPVNIKLESGRSYVSMMNVIMYIARVSGPPSGRALSYRRPTMQS